MMLGLVSVLVVGYLLVRVLRRYRTAPQRSVAVVAAVLLLVPLNSITVADRGLLGPTAVLVVGLGAAALAGVGFLVAERWRDRRV